jgi:hypothetical protein
MNGLMMESLEPQVMNIRSPTEPWQSILAGMDTFEMAERLPWIGLKLPSDEYTKTSLITA